MRMILTNCFLALGLFAASLAQASVNAATGSLSEIGQFDYNDPTTDIVSMFYDFEESLIYFIDSAENSGAIIHVHDAEYWDVATSQVVSGWTTAVCTITVVDADGFARLSGMSIWGSTLYFSDQLGPESDEANHKQKALYKTTGWNNPCGCSGIYGAKLCGSPAVNLADLNLAFTSMLIEVDDVSQDATPVYVFRARGVALGTESGKVFTVNGQGFHSGLTVNEYPKSIVAYTHDWTSFTKWSFEYDTLGADVDLMSVACGRDRCVAFVFFIDNAQDLLFRLTLSVTDIADAIGVEWDLSTTNAQSLTGSVSLAYDYYLSHFMVCFGAGASATPKIYLLDLEDTTEDTGIGEDAAAAPSAGTYKSMGSLTATAAPDGMWFDDAEKMLYVVSSPTVDQDSSIYVHLYDDSLDTQVEATAACTITVAAALGVSKLSGVYISGSVAYLSDELGPEASLLDSSASSKGFNILSFTWSSHPCSCETTNGVLACGSTTGAWPATYVNGWVIAVDDVEKDDYFFRSAGVIGVGSSLLTVNSAGLHSDHQASGNAYPKSLVQFQPSSLYYDVFAGMLEGRWAFFSKTFNRDINLKGLSCGSDACASMVYIIDEFMYVYGLDLSAATAAAGVLYQWDFTSFTSTGTDDDLGDGLLSIAYVTANDVFLLGFGDKKVYAVTLSTPATPAPDDADDGSSGNRLSVGAVTMSMFAILCLMNFIAA